MYYDINEFKPYREGHHTVFTSMENRCTHIGNNINKHMVRQFKVDGDVIKTGQRCDYLLLNDETQTSYYIELKGSDLIKAIDQIDTTIGLIAPSIPKYKVQRRIIYRTGTHKIQTRPVLDWKQKYGRAVVIKERLLEESI